MLNDIVWWNEGGNIGRIDGIFSSKEEINSIGLDEQSVSIRYNGSFGEKGCSVIYPLSAFEDQGIAKLTVQELSDCSDQGI